MKVVVSLYAFAALLLIVGTGAIVVGVHDASLAAAGFGVTLGGAVLLGLGVVLLFAVWDLVKLSGRRSWTDDVRPSCKPIVLVAFLLTFLLGLYVFFAAMRTDGGQRLVVVSAALVVMVVAVLGFVFFGSDLRITLPRLGGTIALTLIGAAIGVWEFWYQNQYVPSHAGRAVAVNVALRRVGEQGAYEAVRATVGYQDIGGRSVSVIGSIYTLTGSRVVRCPRPATVDRVYKLFNGFLTDPQRARFMSDVREEKTTVLAAGKFVGDGKRLDPDVPAARDLLFLVPHNRYQLLRFRAQLFAIPASVQLSQRTLPEYKLLGDNELYGFWHVDDDSWLHDLLYGRERWVIIRYELIDPGNKKARRTKPTATTVSHAMRVTARFPDPTWSEGRPSAAQTKTLFDNPQPTDASEPFGNTELALKGLPARCS